MKVRDMRSYLLCSVTDERTPKKCEGLFERKIASRNLVRNADKITENHADFFIIATALLNQE